MLLLPLLPRSGRWEEAKVGCLSRTNLNMRWEPSLDGRGRTKNYSVGTSLRVNSKGLQRV